LHTWDNEQHPIAKNCIHWMLPVKRPILTSCLNWSLDSARLFHLASIEVIGVSTFGPSCACSRAKHIMQMSATFKSDDLTNDKSVPITLWFWQSNRSIACVCLDAMLTVDWRDPWPRYLTWRLLIDRHPIKSYNKIQDHRRKNVSKVVGVWPPLMDFLMTEGQTKH